MLRKKVRGVAKGPRLASSVNERGNATIDRRSFLRNSGLAVGGLTAASVKLAELDPDSDRISLVDVTPVNRTRNFHNFSLETPEFFDDLFLRLISSETPRSRLLYQIETDDGVVYSVLTRGR